MKNHKKPIFIIEHLEPELFEWCLIEYKNISKITGKNKLWFTNIKDSDTSKLEKYGKVTNQSVRDIKLAKTCILDPNASKTLFSKEAKKFDYFIFGGILGNNPPKKRTASELTRFIKNVKVRNIGKKQFSTDSAVFIVNEIIKSGSLEKMKFQDGTEIKINNIESTYLPYYYPIIKGKTFISNELIKYLKNKRDF